MSQAPYAYAQARLQAHHGRRLDASGWQRLEAAPTFAVYLKQGRQGSLAEWLGSIPSDATPHQVERLLNRQWRAQVGVVAQWLPGSWRPTIEWLAALPNLAAVNHLVGHGTPLPWMREEPSLLALLDGTPPPSGTVDLSPLRATSAPVVEQWLSHWRTLWPKPYQPLDELVRLLMTHQAHFATLPSPEAAWHARQELQRQLTLRFRRYAAQPAAAVCYLALTGLDLEQVRGALLRRLLFAGDV